MIAVRNGWKILVAPARLTSEESARQHETASSLLFTQVRRNAMQEKK
jgi:hypothetical protein